MNERQVYRARWVFSGDSAAVENGVVEIEAGRISALGDRADAAARDLGDVALIPGLVNAHTHLEFSDLAEPVSPATPFTAWIRSLVANRRQRDPSADPVSQGLRESARAGTTTVGEIASPGWNLEDFQSANSRAVIFQELLGLAASQHDAQLALAKEHLAAPREERLIHGISPHAPYSVRPPLYQALVDLAVERGAPLAVHLAETRAELELLKNGRGEFVELLRGFGVWDETAIPRGSRPLDYLRPLEAVQHALVIHGNYLDDEEIAFLAERPQITVVYCPRTHAYFGHTPHPWLRLLKADASVAIGTDGRGSNPDLSVWRELQFLHSRFPQVDPAMLLELGTIRGARALGVDDSTGSLAPGKAADLAVVRLSGGPENLFAAESKIIGVMCGGEWVLEPPQQ